MPLLHGGCIIVAPPDDEGAIEELLCEAGVTAVLMEGPEIADLLEVGSSCYLSSANAPSDLPMLLDALRKLAWDTAASL